MAKRTSTGSRSQVAALIVVGGIVAALLWVAQAIVAHNTLQNCIDSGRRTCLDIGNENAPLTPDIP